MICPSRKSDGDALSHATSSPVTGATARHHDSSEWRVCRSGLAADNRSPRRCAHEDQTLLQWSAALESNDLKSCSGRSAFVPVMEPAHLRDRNDAASTGELYTPWNRCILLQCEVCASPMIVPDERLKVPRQTALVEYHHVIEAFATNCANDPFHIRTLPG